MRARTDAEGGGDGVGGTAGRTLPWLARQPPAKSNTEGGLVPPACSAWRGPKGTRAAYKNVAAHLHISRPPLFSVYFAPAGLKKLWNPPLGDAPLATRSAHTPHTRPCEWTLDCALSATPPSPPARASWGRRPQLLPPPKIALLTRDGHSCGGDDITAPLRRSGRRSGGGGAGGAWRRAIALFNASRPRLRLRTANTS